MTDTPSSRRDFLRSFLGRGANVMRDGLIPGAILPAVDAGGAAGAPARLTEPRPLTPDELARAFPVPGGQEDIARALVAAGRLLEAPDGRVAEPGFAQRVALAPMGAATDKWLSRAREGKPLDPTRPQDAMILHAARGELGA